MLNFFYKTKQETDRENSLKDSSRNSKTTVKNFIKFATSTTEKRSRAFDILSSFALDSDQWTNAELNAKDSDDDVALVFNFSNEYIERYMARIFPRNPQTGVLEVGVKIRETEHEKSQKYEDEILSIYYDYELANILIEQGINFLCGGASCLYYPKDPITKRAQIISLDPTKCYLGWSGGRLVQFAFRDYVGSGKYKYTYYDLHSVIVYDEAIEKTVTVENKDKIIPFSWIPNFPNPHSHEGKSKILQLAELDKAYNRNASNFDKRIEENTEPHIVIKSDMADTTKIERGKKKKTRIGASDDMEYLELKEGQEIINWLNLIEKRISNKTGIVHSAGQVQTNVSGTSLSYQYSDMMDLIGFMRLNWDKAFRQMNNAILTYKFGVDKYDNDPVYQPFLIQDNSDRIEQYAKMIENNLISHKDAIDELRGVENAEEKLQEILAEMKLFATSKPEEKPVEKKDEIV